MTSIKLIVTGAKVRANVDGLLTSGMVGIPVTIEYDGAWKGLTKNLVCRSGQWYGGAGGETRTILNIGARATVAQEVLIGDKNLYLGIEGYNADGTLVIPTVWADCGKVHPGAQSGKDYAAKPTLPVYAQLQQQINELKKAGNCGTGSVQNAYKLPVGGDKLGGVRNGGNVVINQDGTMTAPESTAEIPEPDATLTMEGVAADAKAVGDALANVGQPTDAQISAAVSGWLDEHPEATTAVENGSITNEKLAPEVENRLVCLEDEVFTEEVKTQTGEGVSPDIVLEWTEGYAYGIAKGEYEVNGQYNSTQKFETTVFPEITKPELLTETAGSLVAFWNEDTYVGYWTAGEYHNGGMAVIEKPAFTHAAFSIRTATDYTQIELVYAEVTETVTKISKIQDVRDRTTTLEHKTDILENKVRNLENGGASDGTGDSGEGDTGRQGKKYYLFGDSITYWDSRASWYDDTVYMVAYPSYIRDVLLADIVNCGVAGNTSVNITARLKNTDLTDAYAVTYMSGANDLNQNIPFGTIGEFDTATYIGNIEAAIKYVAETYPHVKLYLLSPLYTSLGDIKPYAEAMESVADHYSVPILRWDQVSQINQFNCNYYLVDGVHPNNLGHAVMADSLIPFLKNH